MPARIASKEADLRITFHVEPEDVQEVAEAFVEFAKEALPYFIQ